MTAKPVAIVTGSNTGIGFQTALALANKGYCVILAVRNMQLGADAAAAINTIARPNGGDAVCMQLDNSKLQSVREFALAFLARYRHLHALVLNAGIAGIGIPRERRLTADGFDVVFQINFLAAFLLCQILIPRLKETSTSLPIAPSRIVLLSSATHRLVEPAADWAALMRKPKPHYAHSKLACTLYAYYLQRQFAEEGSKVSAVAVNPGGVNSDIWRACAPTAPYVECAFRPCRRLCFLNTQQGAATSIAAACAGEVGGQLLRPGRPFYLTPYWIPALFQTDTYTLDIPSLLFDLLGPTRGAKAARSSAASYDPRAARALVASCAEAVARAMDAS